MKRTARKVRKTGSEKEVSKNVRKSRQRKHRVLLIEESTDYFSRVKSMLSSGHDSIFELRHAKTLSEGIGILEKETIDLILVDTGYSDRKGIRTVEKVYFNSPYIPLLVLTDINDQGFGIRTLNKGAHDYLIKEELDARLLSHSITHAIEHHHTQERQIRKIILEKEINEKILNSIDEGIMLLNKELKIVKVNKKLLEQLKADEKDIVGQYCYSATHRRDKPCRLSNDVCPVEEILKTGEPAIYNHTHYDKDGKELFVEVSAYPVLNKHGKVISFVHISRDISERKRVENALWETEERYRNIFENSPISLWEEDLSDVKKYINSLKEKGVTDFRKYLDDHPDAIAHFAVLGKVLDVNKTTLEMYKAASKEEMIGSLGKVLNEETYEVFKNELIALAEGKTVFEAQTTNQTLTGEKRDIVIRWTVAPGYEDSLSKVLVSIIDVTDQKKIEEKLKATLAKLRKSLGGTIQAMAFTVETRDPYTAGHQRRVADLAHSIAKEMGLPDEQVDGVRMAGVIHDIGKISIPAEILSKPGRITEHEFGIIRTHPQVGYDILKEIEFPWPIAQIVLQHHERINGTGYPNGLKGDQIMLEANILAVADVVEAMASHRPYRPSRGIDIALDEISRNKGILYDPEVADACIRVFKEGGFKFNNN
jgi:PAS domain S-box-containing protein/putative nucleotidyltransferase with HDIG domain